MPSRKIEDLVPELQVLCKEHIKRCADEGIELLVYSTLRTKRDQSLLFAKGRNLNDLPDEVKELIPNEIAEWKRQGLTEGPGNVVTWVMDSYHCRARAYDCCGVVDGYIQWDNEPLLKRVAEIGKDLGLTSGFFWKNRDAYHFQLD